MASLTKKTLLLATSLICFVHLVTGQAATTNTAIYPRLEINTFLQDPIRTNILILGLSCMQTTPITSPFSFYQIAGIHGLSNPWNGDSGNFQPGGGYCHHGDVCFPTWHRPFLALFEQCLFSCAASVINKFPNGTVKNQHLASLPTCRLPYWDWAKNSALPNFIGTTYNVTVTTVQNGKIQNVTMHNPWYSCPLNPSDQNTALPTNRKGLPHTVETVRNPISANNIYVSQPNTTNTRMANANKGTNSLKRCVYNSFMMNSEYVPYSNAQSGTYSIENCHNTVHVCVGGSGHMGFIDISGFDPIFFLHHCNIDRLFAIWQVINPNSYISNDTYYYNYYGYDPQDGNSPLYPFQQEPNQPWTSESVRNTQTFGYGYPETMNCSNPPCATAAVNNLYGPNSSKKRRDTTSSYSSTYPEYVVRIKTSSCAASGSYSICIFLGSISTSEDNYATDPNYVGCLDVFAHRTIHKSHEKMVHGTVSLTETLSELVDAGKLADMTPATVKDYVKKNFQYAVIGSYTGVFDASHLKIALLTAKVKPAEDKYCFPKWGKFSTVCQLV